VLRPEQDLPFAAVAALLGAVSMTSRPSDEVSRSCCTILGSTTIRAVSRSVSRTRKVAEADGARWRGELRFVRSGINRTCRAPFSREQIVLVQMG
jgi:hypothetical protein